MEKLTKLVKNEVLHRVRTEGNVLHTIKRRNADWTGCILRRNCHLKHATEGKMGLGEEEEDVSSFWLTLREDEILELKEKAIERTIWRTRFGRAYGSVVTLQKE
jgi:hypothetical protein